MIFPESHVTNQMPYNIKYMTTQQNPAHIAQSQAKEADWELAAMNQVDWNEISAHSTPHNQTNNSVACSSMCSISFQSHNVYMILLQKHYFKCNTAQS